MSEMYKAGDRVEFIEDYMDYKIGDKATVKDADQWTRIHQLLAVTGDKGSATAFSYRVKRAAPEIGIGDLVRINDKTYVNALIGVEGIVTGLGSYVSFKTTEGLNSIHKKGDTGRMPVEKLDVVKTAAQIAEEEKAAEEKKAAELAEALAGPQSGDTVRVTAGAWIGAVGELVSVDAFTGRAYIKILEPTKNCWLAVGTQGTTNIERLEVVKKAQDTEPRIVNLSEVKVGDLVRVTYADQEDTCYGVTNKVRRVREGVVAKASGKELSTDRGQLINAYYDGLAEAVYEVLPTPEPEKVPTWAEKLEIGSTGVQKGGRRFLIKKGEDSWEIRYPSSSSEVVKTDEDIAGMFEEDDFLWTVRK